MCSALNFTDLHNGTSLTLLKSANMNRYGFLPTIYSHCYSINCVLCNHFTYFCLSVPSIFTCVYCAQVSLFHEYLGHRHNTYEVHAYISSFYILHMWQLYKLIREYFMVATVQEGMYVSAAFWEGSWQMLANWTTILSRTVQLCMVPCIHYALSMTTY